MKTFYEAPVMDVVEFEVEDIIATSVMDDSNGNIADNLQPSDFFPGGDFH